MIFFAWTLNLSLFFGSVFIGLHCRSLCGIFAGFMLLAIFSAILISLSGEDKHTYYLNPRKEPYESRRTDQIDEGDEGL